MLDEIFFFQTRIFRMFCMEAKISPVEGDELFSKYGIWDYLKDAYDVLHLIIWRNDGKLFHCTY